MSWLTAHIWFELFLAALLGGLIGWALRPYLRSLGWFGAAGALATGDNGVRSNFAEDVQVRSSTGEGGVRLAELEAQLQAERDEVMSLRSQLSSSETEVEVVEGDEEEGTVEWRNRYLESRVRFLEKQISELEEEAEVEVEASDEPADEATRLLWRNRYLEGRVRYLEEELSKGSTLEIARVSVAPAVTETVEVEGGAAVGSHKPATLSGPKNGVADDLKEIAGVGPKLESVLNGLGIFHFEQIAAWTEREISWVNSAISFKGRIERESWVDQAKALSKMKS